MNLRGEMLIAAPRPAVWAALNDPAVLARCIDGVERLDRESETSFSGTLSATVGPVKARFSGTIMLQERAPPERYVLVGEGKGGVAGFVKGRAEVNLADCPDGGTLLSYETQSQVGGKLAQLGTRLIEGTAKGYAERFFVRLKAELENPAAAAAEAPDAPPAPDTTALPDLQAEAVASPGGLPPAVWLSILVALVLLVLLFLWRQP